MKITYLIHYYVNDEFFGQSLAYPKINSPEEINQNLLTLSTLYARDSEEIITLPEDVFKTLFGKDTVDPQVYENNITAAMRVMQIMFS